MSVFHVSKYLQQSSSQNQIPNFLSGMGYNCKWKLIFCIARTSILSLTLPKMFFTNHCSISDGFSFNLLQPFFLQSCIFRKTERSSPFTLFSACQTTMNTTRRHWRISNILWINSIRHQISFKFYLLRKISK